MAVTNETEFNAADLIGSAGVGENGEKLVATLDTHYPPALSSALLKTENEKLRDGLDLEKVAKTAGVKEIEAATVRGGDRHKDDAWVTYVFLDQRGTPVKGAFPYGDLGKASSDDHVSQRESLMASAAARDFLAAKEKADAAAPAQSSGDPIADYEELKAPDVVAYIEANPDRAPVVAALESALRPGDERVSVMKAVEKAKGDDGSGAGGSGDGQGAGSGDGNDSGSQTPKVTPGQGPGATK